MEISVIYEANECNKARGSVNERCAVIRSWYSRATCSVINVGWVHLLQKLRKRFSGCGVVVIKEVKVRRHDTSVLFIPLDKILLLSETNRNAS